MNESHLIFYHFYYIFGQVAMAAVPAGDLKLFRATSTSSHWRITRHSQAKVEI